MDQPSVCYYCNGKAIQTESGILYAHKVECPIPEIEAKKLELSQKDWDALKSRGRRGFYG